MPKSYLKIGKHNNCLVNSQLAYPFLFQLNSLVFKKPYEFFQFFFHVFQNTVFEKKLRL